MAAVACPAAIDDEIPAEETPDAPAAAVMKEPRTGPVTAPEAVELLPPSDASRATSTAGSDGGTSVTLVAAHALVATAHSTTVEAA